LCHATNTDTIYNQTSFLVLHRTTAVDHAILNVVRRVFIIVASAVFFGTVIDNENLAGIVLAIGGSLAFLRAKQMANKQAKQDKAEKNNL
jgi:uncharacterized membrane protein (DUF373 family)